MSKTKIVKLSDDVIYAAGVKLDQSTLPPVDWVDDVLDQGFVELLDMMPNNTSPDMAVVTAARVSYASESKGEEKDRKLLHYLLKHRHTSPFEQVEFKFRVHAPLVTWWQWVRHRTFSFNFQSGRYTEFKEDAFYLPDAWRLQAKVNKQASEGQVETNVNELLTENLRSFYDYGYRLYTFAIAQGVAREQARLFLPGFSVYYTAIAKVDAHNLMHFMRLRIQKEAQYEIRVYAEAIWKIFKEKMPWTAEWLMENEPEVFS